MTCKEGKARAEQKVNKIVERLAEILETCAQRGLPFEEAAGELTTYTEVLVQMNPQDASLVRRACTEFLKRIKRELKDDEESNDL